MSDESNYFSNPNYETFIVQFNGDFENEINSIPYAHGKKIWKAYGIVAVEKGRYYELLRESKTIIYGEPRGVFIQQDTPIENSRVEIITKNPYVQLTGKGILVGIIDSGIDYLNTEFIREDDTTRVKAIWDQTIVSSVENSVVFGSEYNEGEINKAIELQKNGGDPYSIVPSKDIIGHGTNMASIIGAKGEDYRVKGVLTNCEFAIVKLAQDEVYKENLKKNGIKEVPVYSSANIFIAIQYIIRRGIEFKRPMIIFIPLGSNIGNHLGTTMLEKYIDNVTSYRGLIVITPVGNQASAELHTSGFIKDVESSKTIELNISKELENFSFNIWARRPNRMSLSIISPSGQSTKNIPIQVTKEQILKFIYEDTEVSVRFVEPDELSGNENIIIIFKNIKPGIWKFILRGEYILDGRYDAWLPMKEILPDGTRFLKPDPLLTLVNPSSAQGVITVGYFNQMDSSVVSKSGKGINENKKVKPEIVAGGINQPVTNPGGKVSLLSGSCVAAAVVAGACGILFEWGIVDGNDRSMTMEKVRAYLIAGARRRVGDIYPNETFGYGILDVESMFNQMEGKNSVQYRESESLEGNIYYRIPRQIGGDWIEFRKGRMWIFR